MKIHYIQHVPFEGLGNIEQWAKENNHTIEKTRVYDNETFPESDDFDFLIILGGPMSVHDTEVYPWLRKEKEFISKAIKSGKIMLGICLGAQLIADVLGAKVKKAKEKEIGWFKIKLSDNIKTNYLCKIFPDDFIAFHWHGEEFELPDNAINIGSSCVCANQGFIYKEKVVGLQFHLESNPGSIQDLISNCKEELVKGNYIQARKKELLDNANIADIKNILYKLLNALSKS